jgi:hypothetical protein
MPLQGGATNLAGEERQSEGELTDVAEEHLTPETIL